MRRLFCFRHLMIAKNSALTCTTWTLEHLPHCSILHSATFTILLPTGVFSGKRPPPSFKMRTRRSNVFKLIFPAEKPVSVLFQTWRWNTRRIWVFRNGKQEMEPATTMWKCWEEQESFPEPKTVWKINLTILYARRAKQIGSSSWTSNRSINKTYFILIFLYPQKLQHVFTYQTSSLPPNYTDKHVQDEVCKLNKLFLRAGRILGLGKKSQT